MSVSVNWSKLNELNGVILEHAPPSIFFFFAFVAQAHAALIESIEADENIYLCIYVCTEEKKVVTC